MGFLDHFVIAKTERYLLHGGQLNGKPLAGLVTVLESFTPDGLQAFVEADQSLVVWYRESLQNGLREEGLQAMQKRRDQVMAGIQGVDWDRVLHKIARVLPQHAEVLGAFPAWYHREAEGLAQLLREVLDGQPQR